jgi:hypothetical protein
MTKIVFYKNGKKVHDGTYKQEQDGRVLALVMNWQYMVVAEY